jgi:hypothetical protein
LASAPQLPTAGGKKGGCAPLTSTADFIFPPPRSKHFIAERNPVNSCGNPINRFRLRNAGSRKQEQPKPRGETPHDKQAKGMQNTSNIKKTATPESVGSIDETVLTRFRNSKAEVMKKAEKFGNEAGVRFVEHIAEYADLLRLERWWQESENEPKLDLEELGLHGLAKLLAGDNGDAADLEKKIRRLADSDATEGRWIEGFITGALRRFEQIQAKM